MPESTLSATSKWSKSGQVELPDMIVGIVRCANPKCITNHEPMATRFDVVDRDDVTLRCCYCGQSVGAREASIIE